MWRAIMYILKNISLPNYYKVKNMPIEQQAILIQQIIDKVLSKVIRIEAKIHKLTLYTKLDDKQIERAFSGQVSTNEIVPNVLLKNIQILVILQCVLFFINIEILIQV